MAAARALLIELSPRRARHENANPVAVLSSEIRHCPRLELHYRVSLLPTEHSTERFCLKSFERPWSGHQKKPFPSCLCSTDPVRRSIRALTEIRSREGLTL